MSIVQSITMRYRVGIIFITLISSYAHAQTYHNRSFVPGYANEQQLREHGHYYNKDGEDVHSPAHSLNGVAPNGATALCRDGEYSFSHTSSGTCSRHGGVSKWLR